MTGELDRAATFAVHLAEASRALLHQPDAIAAEVKADGSPVTALDRAVEDRLRAMIAERFPRHGVIGEERGADCAGRSFVWTLDPIDGTLPFLAGIPVYGTLIALLRDGEPVIGVADMPATNERWVGRLGAPSTRNGAPVRARACGALAGALLSTSNPDFYGETDAPALARLKAATRWTVYGGSCMAYLQLASGRIDLGLDVGLEPFDYLALAPIIAGAGGIVTDWRGAPLTLASGDRVLAAGDRRRHAEALALLG